MLSLLLEYDPTTVTVTARELRADRSSQGGTIRLRFPSQTFAEQSFSSVDTVNFNRKYAFFASGPSWIAITLKYGTVVPLQDCSSLLAACRSHDILVDDTLTYLELPPRLFVAPCEFKDGTGRKRSPVLLHEAKLRGNDDVAGIRYDDPGQPVDNSFRKLPGAIIVPKAPHTTSITVYNHNLSPLGTRWTELWHTRMTANPERASNETLKLRAIRARRVAANDPFEADVTALDDTTRIALIESTSDGHETIDVNPGGLVLTPLGAHVDIAWAQPPPKSGHYDVCRPKSWKYRAGMGRQGHQERTYLGFLYPFGHPATLVVKSVRKFAKSTVTGRRLAYLQQYFQIHIEQDTIDLDSTSAQLFGLKSVKVAIRDAFVSVTGSALPDLPVPGTDTDPACHLKPFLIGNVPLKPDGSAEYEFPFVGTDIRDGADKHFSSPVIWLNELVKTVGNPKASFKAAALAFSAKRLTEPALSALPYAPNQHYSAGQTTRLGSVPFVCVKSGVTSGSFSLPDQIDVQGLALRDGDVLWHRFPLRNDILFQNQLVGLTTLPPLPSPEKLDAAAVEVVSMTLNAGVQLLFDDATTSFSIRPRLQNMNVRIPALKQLIGDAAAIPIRIPKKPFDGPLNMIGMHDWLPDLGAVDGGHVYAEVVDPLVKGIDADFNPADKARSYAFQLANDAENAIKTGAATYGQQLAALSALTGAIYGAVDEAGAIGRGIITDAINGTWNPILAWDPKNVVTNAIGDAVSDAFPRIFGVIDLKQILAELDPTVNLRSVVDEASGLSDNLRSRIPKTLHVNDKDGISYTYKHQTSLRDSVPIQPVPELLTFRSGDNGSPGQLTYEQVVSVARNGTASSSLRLALDNCGLDIGPGKMLKLDWKSLSLKYRTGSSVAVTLDGLTYGVGSGVLEFVQKLLAALNPNNSGLIISLTDLYLELGYSTPQFPIAFGAFEINDLSLGLSLKLPLSDDGGTISPLVSLNIARPEKPFTLALAFLGGGGSFGIDVDIQTKAVRAYGSFEVGAYAGLNFFVASGYLRIAIGLMFDTGDHCEASSTASMIGYFHAEGSLSVLGLITADVVFHADIAYHSGSTIDAEAYYMVSVNVLFFSASYKLRMAYRFDLGNGQATAAKCASALARNGSGSVLASRATMRASNFSGTEPPTSTAGGNANGEQLRKTFRTVFTRQDWIDYSNAFA